MVPPPAEPTGGEMAVMAGAMLSERLPMAKPTRGMLMEIG
jgi:hypothetical protein